MPIALGGQAFQTFQVTSRYEAALRRHAQWVRWTPRVLCACVSPTTGQASPGCPICKGRGRVYTMPLKFRIMQEFIKHNNSGKCYPENPPWGGTPRITRQGSVLALAGSQPSSVTIQLNPPYYRSHEILTADYDHTTSVAVVDENSDVYAANILRVEAGKFWEQGKEFRGSVRSVSNVYNVTKTESYTVGSFAKEFIYLTGMGTWTAGDVLQVDYNYIPLFPFILIGVSQRIRYETPWALEDADATLITPYWCRPAPDDLFTALAQEQIGRSLASPQPSGNDFIRDQYDVVAASYLIDKNGVEYEQGTNFIVVGRNELKWLTAKPTVPYSVQYTYHPTYVGLTNFSTLRTSENKVFANRLGVKKLDRMNNEQVW